MRSHWISQKAHVSGAVEVNVTFYLEEMKEVSFAQLSFSYYRPIEMFPHPTSLERKLDVEEKRVIYACNW